MRKLPDLGARKYRAPIINRPDQVPIRQRLTLAVLTGALWAVWLYLWSPLITLLLWLLATWLGWRVVAPVMAREHLLTSVLQLLAVAGVLGLLLLLWATVEYLRFRNVSRRRWAAGVSTAELASSELTHAGLTKAQIEAWQQSRRLLVEHDEEGRVSGADQP